MSEINLKTGDIFYRIWKNNSGTHGEVYRVKQIYGNDTISCIDRKNVWHVFSIFDKSIILNREDAINKFNILNNTYSVQQKQDYSIPKTKIKITLGEHKSSESNSTRYTQGAGLPAYKPVVHNHKPKQETPTKIPKNNIIGPGNSCKIKNLTTGKISYQTIIGTKAVLGPKYTGVSGKRIENGTIYIYIDKGIEPSSELGKKLLGKKVGDIFFYNNATYQIETID